MGLVIQRGELYYHSNHASEITDNKIVDAETHLVKSSVRNPVGISNLDPELPKQPQCITQFFVVF